MSARAAPAEAGPSAPGWRLLLGSGLPADSGPAVPLVSRGAWNMAVDDALLAGVHADPGAAPALRFYRWDPPCLSLGRNQPAAAALEPDGPSPRGWDVVRRPTGGLAVLHAEELTYAVAGSVDDLGRPRAAYAAINLAFAEGLRALGVEARVVGQTEGAADPVGGSEARCFRAAAAGEVSVRGKKILGSAQRRSGRAILQHGSLLLSGSQHAVADVLGHASRESSEPAGTTLAEHLPRMPSDSEILAALTRAFARQFAVRLAPATLTEAELTLAERALETYTSEAWTWRR